MSQEGEGGLSNLNMIVDETRNEEEEDLSLLLRQKVWQGRLPTKLSLAANESKSFTNSPPLYVNAPSNLTDVAPTSSNTLLTMFSGANYLILQN